MCAIAGLIGHAPPRNGTMRTGIMLESLRHRGPDDRGIYESPDGRVILGHNRLSIIDLSRAGHQPMIDEESGDALVFNGEVYNFEELRAELVTAGATFRSRTDTEVLLKSLSMWGVTCLPRLRGMFAFAYWRARDGVTILARDPLGMKPLYYRHERNKEFIFASELKALLALPGAVKDMDVQSLHSFLEFGYTFDEQRTCMRGISKLPPGQYIEIDRTGIARDPVLFHQLGSIEPRRPRAEDELYATLSKVVRQHLVADVPVGLLLSGGLDSSILAAIASKQTRVRTITMGFAGSQLDERHEARIVADAIGSEHEEILIAPEDISAELVSQVSVMDDLFADWGTISTRLLYRKCRERGIKVVIVGEGSDELFGGYDVFRRASSNMPEELWLFGLYRFYAGRRYGRLYPKFRSIMKDYLRQEDGNRFQAIRLFEVRRQLPNNYVMKVDKASMAESVEARAPYLDTRVADLAFRTGADDLISSESEKLLLRRMASRYNLLPVRTLQRRKLGGSIASSWMDEDMTWRAYARKVILFDGKWTKALGLDGAMKAYFDRNMSGYPAPHPISIFRNLAWRLLLLELWSQAYGVEPANS